MLKTTAYSEIKENANALEMMEEVFKGRPSKEEIKPVLDSVMLLYNLPVTERNYHKCASCLIGLRKSYDVTEMNILKTMLQGGRTKSSFPEGATVSAFLLSISTQ